jgi:hypothetical protein
MTVCRFGNRNLSCRLRLRDASNLTTPRAASVAVGTAPPLLRAPRRPQLHRAPRDWMGWLLSLRAHVGDGQHVLYQRVDVLQVAKGAWVGGGGWGGVGWGGWGEWVGGGGAACRDGVIIVRSACDCCEDVQRMLVGDGLRPAVRLHVWGRRPRPSPHRCPLTHAASVRHRCCVRLLSSCSTKR